MSVFYFDSAAQDPEQVSDDLAFENLGVVGFQAVQNLAPHWHDRLELTIPSQLNAAQSRVALYNIELPPVSIPGTAINKFLYPIGNVHGSSELLFDIQPGLFRVLPGPFIDQHLTGNPVGSQ